MIVCFKITLKISLELLLLDMLFTLSASWNFHENLFTVSVTYMYKKSGL